MTGFFLRPALTALVVAMSMLLSPESAARQLHYWFDGRMKDVHTLDPSARAIDCTSLAPGFHSVTMYTDDAETGPSVPETRWFYRGMIDGTANRVRIFVDDKFYDEMDVTTSELMPLDIYVPDLEKGTHRLSLILVTADGTPSTLGEADFESLGPVETGYISLSVADPAGNDITDRIEISWRNTRGELLVSGPRITGLAEGDTVTYSLALPEELGTKYREIRRRQVVCMAGNTVLADTLMAFAPVEFRGTVTDGSAPIEGVKIKLRQYPNDRFITADSTVTAPDGSFAITLIDAPTRLDCSLDGYLDAAAVIEQPLAEGAMPVAITMTERSRKSIMPALTFNQATVDGPAPVMTYPFALSDIHYAVTAPDGGEVTAGVLSDGRIALPKGITEGMTLTVTLSSASGSFAETSGMVTLSADDVTAMDFTLSQPGGIESRYDDASAGDFFTAHLYDASGAILRSSTYRSGVAAFASLPDGSYTILSISDKAGVGTLASLADYAMLGLAEGMDYATRQVTVRGGYVSVATHSSLPVSDGKAISAITAGSNFSVNKTHATGSEMITATLRLNLDEETLAAYDSGVLHFSLPEGCEYEEGSMYVNGRVVPVNISGNNVSVNVDREQLASRIRFCMHSTVRGDYRVSAMLALGGSIKCYAGETFFSVSDYDLHAPAIVARPEAAVSGNAMPFGTVDIYDGDVQVGQTTADGFGKWHSTVSLNNPVNLSDHPLWMRLTGSDGNEYRSSAHVCRYDKDHIVPARVTMLNTVHGIRGYRYEEVSVFDLGGGEAEIDQRSLRNNYIYWPAYPEFTFLIDFSRNDPEAVSAVELSVFTELDKRLRLPAEYNATRGCWVTSFAFDPNDLPVNVAVDYVAATPREYDTTETDKAADEMMASETALSEITDLISRIDSIQIESNNDPDSIDVILNALEIRLYGDESDNDFGIETDVIYTQYEERVQNAGSFEEALLIDEDFMEQIESMDLEALQPYKDYGTPKSVESFSNSDGSGLKLSLNTSSQNPSVEHGINLSDYLPDPFSLNDTDLTMGIVNGSNSKTGTQINFDMRDFVGTIPDEQEDVADFYRNLSEQSYGYVQHGLSILDVEAGRLHDKFRANRQKSLQIRKSQKLIERLASDESLRPQTRENAKKVIAKKQVLRKQLAKANASHLQGISNIKKIVGKAGALGVAADAVMGYADWKANDKPWISLINDIEELCKDDVKESLKNKAEQERKQDNKAIGQLNAFKFGVSTTLTVAGAVASPTFAGALVCWGLSSAAGYAFDRQIDKQKNKAQQIRVDIRSQMKSSSDCDYPKPKDDDDDDDPDPDPRNNKIPGRDPSGYVYEGVRSMPVEGVTASLFFTPETEPADDAEGTLWDAEAFSQVNPQLTDTEGHYGWDVPRGSWRVVFEKEGYESARTGWLPVPPPQLDVNMSLRRTSAARVKEAHAYDDLATVEFDTYMDASTVTAPGVVTILTASGDVVAATVRAANAETAQDGTATVLASRFEVVPEEAIPGPTVTMVIAPQAATYAGVRMDGEVRLTLTLEPRVTEFTVPAAIQTSVDNTAYLRVKAEPAEAAAGRRLTIIPSSEMMIAVPTEEAVTFDDEGYASVPVTGLLPGSAALNLAIEGTTHEASTRVVIAGDELTPAMPEASPAAGRVPAGTAVTLSCATEGAEIWYTLDGSCPCDPASGRMLYDGTPIFITADTELRAMAVRDGHESETAVFTYTVGAPASGVESPGEEADVKVWPVPVRDMLTVEAPGYDHMDISIVSMTGAAVLRHEATGPTAVIDVSRLAAGSYLVVLTDGTGRSTTRRIVKL